jgi:hypothetical protein
MEEKRVLVLAGDYRRGVQAARAAGLQRGQVRVLMDEQSPARLSGITGDGWQVLVEPSFWRRPDAYRLAELLMARGLPPHVWTPSGNRRA